MNHTAVRHQAPVRSRSNCEAPREPSAPRNTPPRHKVAAVTWLGAYAVITGLLAVLGPVMSTWPLVLRTLLLSVLMVIALTWVIIPVLMRVFRGWLAS
ncbi:MAG TPA: hypothetical protein VHF58_04825 [Solirubrobacterales bacterium]|nr:hypothetical protein [Solirubrobacterales bacterium]